jgi:hypothetical protein
MIFALGNIFRTAMANSTPFIPGIKTSQRRFSG